MRDKIKNNQKININEFKFNIDELRRGGRGPLLDIAKLDNISSEFFSYLYSDELYDLTLSWARKYDIELHTALSVDSEYTLRVLGIERRSKEGNINAEGNVDLKEGNVNTKIRKDIVKLSDMRQQYYYFFDDLYSKEKDGRQLDHNYPFSTSISRELKEKIANLYILNTEDNNNLNKSPQLVSMDMWLTQMKEFAIYFGYDKFANFMSDLRLALTLEDRTPNLYDVMMVMGQDKVIGRL